jgi:hypothetical protein
MMPCSDRAGRRRQTLGDNDQSRRLRHKLPIADPERGRPARILEKFGAPKTKDDEATAPKPQLVELPARVHSMLTALLVIVAALLVVTFLR